MSFFRTKDRRRDPTIDEGARVQRRQQLQMQQQRLDAHKSAVPAPDLPAREPA